MIVLQSVVYQALYGVWVVTAAFLYLPALILPWPAIRFVATSWTRSVFALLRWTVGLDYRIEGRENLPEGPAIIASRHESTWDTMIFPLILERPAVIIKRELFWLPFYGWYARKYGCIGIDRASGGAGLRRLMREARVAVEEGRPIVLFPEGTRAPPGKMQPVQPGVVALYRDLGLPVVPVALDSGRFWPRRSLIRRPGTITLRFLPPIPPGLDRRQFLARLEGDLAAAQHNLHGLSHELTTAGAARG